MSDKTDDRLQKLVKENNERVKKVEELTQQVEQCKAAIATLKEEHDFTRGQITLLNDLAEEAQGDKKGK